MRCSQAISRLIYVNQVSSGDIQRGHIDKQHQIQHDGESAMHWSDIRYPCDVISIRSIIKALPQPLIQLHHYKFNHLLQRRKRCFKKYKLLSTKTHKQNVRYTTYTQTSVKEHMVQVATTETPTTLNLIHMFRHKSAFCQFRLSETCMCDLLWITSETTRDVALTALDWQSVLANICQTSSVANCWQ